MQNFKIVASFLLGYFWLVGEDGEELLIIEIFIYQISEVTKHENNNGKQN